MLLDSSIVLEAPFQSFSHLSQHTPSLVYLLGEHGECSWISPPLLVLFSPVLHRGRVCSRPPAGTWRAPSQPLGPVAEERRRSTEKGRNNRPWTMDVFDSFFLYFHSKLLYFEWSSPWHFNPKNCLQIGKSDHGWTRDVFWFFLPNPLNKKNSPTPRAWYQTPPRLPRSVLTSVVCWDAPTLWMHSIDQKERRMTVSHMKDADPPTLTTPGRTIKHCNHQFHAYVQVNLFTIAMWRGESLLFL